MSTDIQSITHRLRSEVISQRLPTARGSLHGRLRQTQLPQAAAENEPVSITLTKVSIALNLSISLCFHSRGP